MKRFIKRFRFGQKGFTLIELLVVVAILGVLAAVAVPNVGKFIGAGKTQAAETELHNVQTAVMAAMADASTGNVSNPGTFGNINLTVPPSGSVDCTVAPGITVGDYIVGNYQQVSGSYTISATGDVVQVGYPQ